MVRNLREAFLRYAKGKTGVSTRCSRGIPFGAPRSLPLALVPAWFAILSGRRIQKEKK